MDRTSSMPVRRAQNGSSGIGSGVPGHEARVKMRTHRPHCTPPAPGDRADVWYWTSRDGDDRAGRYRAKKALSSAGMVPNETVVHPPLRS